MHYEKNGKETVALNEILMTVLQLFNLFIFKSKVHATIFFKKKKLHSYTAIKLMHPSIIKPTFDIPKKAIHLLMSSCTRAEMVMHEKIMSNFRTD